MQPTFPGSALAWLALLAGPAAAAVPALDWQTRGVGGGGALFSPSFNPSNPQELWISCDMSELFQSKTLGASWAMIPFRKIQGNRESCVRFTSDPNVLFTLDYTGDFRQLSRSGDGGRTWSVLPNYPNGDEPITFWADPASTQRLLFNSYDTIYFSSNGGSTWSTAYSTASGDGVRMAGVFWDGTDIVIGTNQGVVASTNSGTSFTLRSLTGIPAGQSIVSMAGGRSGTTRRLVCATVTGTTYNDEMVEDFYSMQPTGPTLYTLDWGTSTAWQAHTTGTTSTHMVPWVGMATNDVSVLWAAGMDPNENPVIYRSIDAGAHWNSVLNTTNNGNAATGWAGAGGDRGWSYGGNPVGFAVAPNDATKAAFTDYGFCHLTTNGGTSWRQAYVKPADQNPAGSNTPTGRSYHSVGLENTTCWQVFFATTSRLLLGNSDIRGSKSDDGGYSWNFNYTGHSDNSMYRVVKASSGKLYAATSSVHDLYQSTYLTDARIDGGSGKVIVSADNGSSWTLVKNFGKPVIWVATDPTNSTRLYASVIHGNGGAATTLGGIFRTDNLTAATPTWTQCTAPAGTEGHPYNIVVLNDGTVIATYSGRRTTTFTPSSGVFVSTNQGGSWTNKSHANMKYWTKDLVVDPNDAAQNTWYGCVFNGWGGTGNGFGGVYRTTDRGAHWTQIFSNTNVPGQLANVESITVHPTNANIAYVTTETEGLWYTSNLTAASPTWEAVTTYPFRQPTRVFLDPADTGKIWVTSFGHGLCVGNAPLASWREEQFGPASTNAAISGDDADPDGDGVRNLAEFAQHTNPLQPDSFPLIPNATAGLPVLSTNAGGWKFEFLRRSSGSNPGITYIAESSTDLNTWLPLSGSPQTTTLDDTWERISWTLGNGASRLFFRLRFTRP